MKKLFVQAAVGVLAFSAPAWADGGYGSCGGYQTVQTEVPQQTTQTTQSPRQTVGMTGKAAQPGG